LKILVLFCGGTIVMEETSNGSYATPKPDRAKDILLNLEPSPILIPTYKEATFLA
jgi:L-asparaginase/Glu-tRNA(Gln) amidotransferase subunit D